MSQMTRAASRQRGQEGRGLLADARETGYHGEQWERARRQSLRSGHWDHVASCESFWGPRPGNI